MSILSLSSVWVCFLIVGLFFFFFLPLAYLGLGSIIECGAVNTDLGTLYMCEVCKLRLSKADMRNHIMGSLHRYSYIVCVLAANEQTICII